MCDTGTAVFAFPGDLFPVFRIVAGAVVCGGVARWIAGLRDPEVSPVLAVAASLIGLATLPLAVFVFLVSAGCLDGTGCWG